MTKLSGALLFIEPCNQMTVGIGIALVALLIGRALWNARPGKQFSSFYTKARREMLFITFPVLCGVTALIYTILFSTQSKCLPPVILAILFTGNVIVSAPGFGRPLPQPASEPLPRTPHIYQKLTALVVFTVGLVLLGTAAFQNHHSVPLTLLGLGIICSTTFPSLKICSLASELSSLKKEIGKIEK